MRRLTERKKLLDVFVVQAQNRRAVERHLLDEFEERCADLDDGRVMIQMFAVDVGDDGENRAELEKRAVAFIRLDHQEIALPDARIGSAHGRGLAAHHDGRIEPARLRTVAIIEVVVVLPWLPAIAMPYFSRINSASSSPRGITGILQPARFLHLRDWRRQPPS